MRKHDLLLMVAAALCAAAISSSGLAQVTPPDPDMSPLQVILDGRDAVAATELTEEDTKKNISSLANIILYGCGFLSIALVALSLHAIYRGNEDGDPNKRRQGYAGAAIAGLIAIPAVIAAVVPELIF